MHIPEKNVHFYADLTTFDTLILPKFNQNIINDDIRQKVQLYLTS